MTASSAPSAASVSAQHTLFPRLLADVGGTNARFARQAAPGAQLEDIRVLPGDDFDSLQAAIEAYLESVPVSERPRAAAIAIANPVTGDEVRMTNRDWVFSQKAMKEALGLKLLRVINDFTALALALPDLAPDELRQIGGGAARPDAAVALVGAGTGLGVSGLVPNGHGGWAALAGEGGHVSLPVETPRERLVADGLVAEYGHASAERLLSGQGLADACRILCEADGVKPEQIPASAADVTRLALSGELPQAQEALTMFCALLGSVAANVALTLGAQGGVYVGGGIVPRLGGWFDRSPFRQRFEAKGRFASYLGQIPVWVIMAKDSPALLGAARSLDH
ncbi:glucokinase [Hydrogenophaga sp. 5NK40-0174]|uniref:glucokinase n=1 Tax=Hydrogenophaga sp. 5NK40-0174 TaxID=3127649 RepID=UPI003109DC19